MKELSALALRVAGLSLLWAVADMLLPSGRARDAARFVAGLIILLSLITPVANLLGRFPEEVAAKEAALMEQQYVVAQARAYSYDDTYKNAVLERYKRGVAETVASLAAKRGLQDAQVEVAVDSGGNITGISVCVDSAAPALNELRRDVSELLNVSEALVTAR